MRAFLALATCVLSAAAMATPEQMEAFHRAFLLKESSRLFKAQCMTCHTSPPEHNPFGKDVRSALKASGKDLITIELIRSLDAKDSDGDGWSNAEEIKQDFLPGDPKSHPAGMPPKATNHEGMMGADMNAKSDPAKTGNALDALIPRHSFHPLVIHFPIALFIFGAFLELVGWRRKHSALRDAAWWCLLAGALSTLIAVPTGFLLFYRSGFQWQGLALVHVPLALTATALMIATVLWRRKGAHQSLAYFGLLALATVVLSVAGHFGAQMVWGG